MILVVANARDAEQGAGVTNVLIDIVLLGIVAFAASKRIGRHRAVSPAGPNSFVSREQPVAVAVEAPTRATAAPRAEAAMTLPAYILGGERAVGSGDSMAETLAMMSGPGICTPRQS